MKSEVRVREVEVKIYIAEDGKEFINEYECKSYEKNLNRVKNNEKINKLRIFDLDNMIPLNSGALPCENNYYRWYLVNSVEDIEALEGAYGEKMVKVSSFPDMICVEYSDEYFNDVYSYTLHDIILEAKDFFNKVGYSVDFNKVNK